MPWSTAYPGPSEPVLGDPASLAALGSALQLAAAQLRVLLGELDVAGSDTPSTTRRLHRTRLRDLRTRGGHVVEAMELAGRRVTQHSGELADAVAMTRRIGERASEIGLVLDGGTLTRTAGVHGVADGEAEHIRAETGARLQRVLDSVLLDLDSARGSLRRDLDEARTRCARG